MKIKYIQVIIYLLSILVLILFFYSLISHLNKKQFDIINFIDSDINEDFEFQIANNLDNINDYLSEYLFIESHLLKRQNNEINIYIKIKEPFAKNNLTNEVIFYDNSIAPIDYFNTNFMNNIKLIDISEKSIQINEYLIENYQILMSIFEFKKIEYIDDRRYNLVLSNGRIIMLPKVIDSKLLYFIKNNIDLIDKNTNYSHFLDLRNFHNKTIRLK